MQIADDDKELVYIRRDLSGGMNNRQHGSNIGENQATVLNNVDLTVAGETLKRPGLTLVEDLGNDAGVALVGFEPQGGTNQLIAMHGTKLESYPGSGTFTERKTDFTATTRPTMFTVGESGEGDVLMIGNGTNNWFRMNQSYTFSDLGNTNTSPPISNVGTYYRNRMWVLDSDGAYFSDAFDDDYSGAFDRTTNVFKIPVGQEQAIIGLRDLGLIFFGQSQVWALNPSTVPVATDKPEKLYDRGCVAGNTVCQVGDDVYFLSQDGVRGLFRTAQDKLQIGASNPISFPLKAEYESLSWAYINNACAVYFDNKYFLSVPVDASTYNNEVWVYYPAYQSWMVITGWNVAAWGKVSIDGQEKLYAIDSTDGKVYQAWKGFSDNGTAITYLEESRKDDFKQPLINKFGGYLKIKAISSGDYDLTVSASVDDQGYVTLGTMNLAGNAPVLPISLPFDLAANNVVEETFPLDSLGEFNQIRIKIEHAALNGSDDIKIIERSILTYANEYTP